PTDGPVDRAPFEVGKRLQAPPGQHGDADLQRQAEQERPPDDAAQPGIAQLLGRQFEGADHCGPTTPAALSALISPVEKPFSASTSSVCWPRLAAGPLTPSLVREKRGAGAGCGKPETST